jgi:Spy/CpxP family protein refolding chaperone
MKKTLLVGVGVVGGLVLAAGAAFAAAQGMHMHPANMMRHMVSAHIERMEDAIDASPQQRAVIEQAKDEVFDAIKAKANPQQRQQLVAILTADKLDTDALYAMANQRAQNIQDLAKVIVPELQKVHDVLSPQQRQMLAQKAQQHMQKMQQHEQHKGGFGGPEE